MKEMRRKL